MYRIVGREVLGSKRYGRFEVEFSHPWIENVKNLYLVSIFTSYFPGRIRLIRGAGNRGFARVKLLDGEYPYIFLTDSYEPVLDSENSNVTEVDLHFRKMRASLAIIGIKELREAYREGGFHPEYVIHLESEPAYVHEYFGATVIRLRAIRDEIDEVHVEFIKENGEKGVRRAHKIHSDEYTDFFQAKIKGSLSGYKFILNVNGTARSFGYNGLDDQTWIIPKEVKGLNKPVWWLGAIYYSIFVDSFDRGSKKPFPSDLPRAIPSPRTHGYLGGDLEGILRRIDYLKDLGVEAIYVTPIYRSATYHRYDVIDHLNVDPLIGNIEIFEKLVERLHKEGIKIVLDLVAHHTSLCSRFFVDALLNGAKSRYWNWYIFKVNDIDEVPREVYKALINLVRHECRGRTESLKGIPFYESFANSWNMPRLNHENEEVIKYFEEVIGFWMEKGIDGFRVDVANALHEKPLRRMYRKVKGYGDDKVFILEISFGVEHYSIGLIADSAMNYDLRKYLLDFFLYKKMCAYEFVSAIMRQYLSLPVYAANALYNLLGSHDTPRIATLVGESKEALYSLYAFLFVTYGSPSLYYGDEIGLEGFEDPDCRRPMLWDERLWDIRLYSHIKRLINIRKKFKVLRHGLFKISPLNRDVIKVIRYMDSERFVAVFNRSTTQFKLKLGLPAYDVENNIYIKSKEIKIPKGYTLLYLKKSK
ncbi:MAG: glycoside hydrolase family 13 protein [Thermoprotei archaeon]|nr:MAG: glycoside hydrolase family 13 protein [Thermoprotei archaeon]